MSDSLTFEIDNQQIVLDLHDPDSTALEAALSQLGDALKAALAAHASLSLRAASNKVDLSQLQAWLQAREFDVSATEVLNDLLSESGVEITEFAIAASGKFTIALKVRFQDAIATENLSPEIRQIIQGPEVGLGICHVV
ncbi:MAG: hypothetical protein AAGF01_32585 [Cyanobacteria bacterium P01_G01_bin.38]